LYPDAFLNDLQTLEELRRTVETAPSDRAIEAYHDGYLAMSDAHRAYIDALVPLIQEGPQTRGALETWGGSLDTDSFLSGLRAIDDARDLRDASESRRFDCYRGIRRACPPLTEEAQRLLAEIRTDQQAPSLPSPDIREHADIFERYYRSTPEETYTVLPSDGIQPTAALTDAACAPGFETAYYRYWETMTPQGVVARRMELMNDIYMSSEDGGDPYHSYMRSMNVEAEHLSAGNFYLCPESGDDYGRVMRLYALRDAIIEHPLGGTDAVLASLETPIIEDPLLSEARISAYLGALRARLSEEGEYAFEARYGDGSILQAYRLFHVYREQTAGLDYALGTMTHLNLHLARIAPLADPDPWYMATMRSYVSFLLLPYNRSVVPSDRISFIAAKKHLDAKRAGIDTYRNSGRGPDEMLSFMERARERVNHAYDAIDQGTVR
jgi:hypothetical protein